MRTLWYIGVDFATMDYAIARENKIQNNVLLVERNEVSAKVREEQARHRAKVAEIIKKRKTGRG